MLTNKQKKTTKKKGANLIPDELMPFFLIVVSHKTQLTWAEEVYHKLIVPYIEDLIEKTLLKINQNELQNLILLKTFFSHPKDEANKKNRSLLLQLVNGVKYVDKLAWKCENYLFKMMVQQEKLPFNAFLPNKFKIYLRKILKIQVLLYIKKELSRLEKNKVRSRTIDHFKTWLQKEFQSRTVVVKNSNNFLNHKHYHPSFLWYFFNGSPRLFMFVQLEYLKLKTVARNWFNWVLFLDYKNFSYFKIMVLLPLSSVKFLFDLLFIALIPYRFLRSVVNELSTYISLLSNEMTLIYCPDLYNKNSFIILNFLWQFSIYLCLIFCFGLPIIPIPLSFIPSLFFSPVVPIIVFSYYSSVIFSSIFACIYSQGAKYKKMLAKSPALNSYRKNTKDTVHDQMAMVKTKTKMGNPLFDRFCNQRTKFKSLMSQCKKRHSNSCSKTFKY